MKNKHIIYLLILPLFCLIFVLSGCYQEEDDKPTVYEVSRLNVVADDIPEVTNALLQR